MGVFWRRNEKDQPNGSSVGVFKLVRLKTQDKSYEIIGCTAAAAHPTCNCIFHRESRPSAESEGVVLKLSCYANVIMASALLREISCMSPVYAPICSILTAMSSHFWLLQLLFLRLYSWGYTLRMRSKHYNALYAGSALKP